MAIKVEQLADIEQKSSLPEGWHWKSIADVCLVNPSMSRPEGFLDTTEVSFVPMSAVDDRTGTITSPEIRTVSDVWKGYKRFQNRDVIFARITPCMENGKAAIAGDLINGIACGSTEFHVLRAHPDKVIPEWLYHLVRQKSFRDEASANFTGTAGQLRVPSSFLEKQIIPVPPVSEQERIVSRIEDILRQIRTARAAFENIPSLLKAFRQSVLAAAFRGDLTEREPGDEPAEKLLERIRAERRRKWEEGLREKGKDPEKFEHAEPLAPDMTNLPELPNGWVWVRVSDVAEVRLGRQRSPSRATGPHMRPYLRAANVTWNGLDLLDVKEMDFTPDEQKVYDLRNGDILLNEASGSVSEVGKPAIWRGEILGCCFQNTLIRVRSEGPLSDYLYFHFFYDALANRFSQSTQGIGINHLGAKGLSEWVIALPSIEEQRRIVTKLVSSFSEIRTVGNAIRIASRRLDALEQAALARAFRGEL